MAELQARVGDSSDVHPATQRFSVSVEESSSDDGSDSGGDTTAEPDVVFDPDQYGSTQGLRDDPVGVFDTRADMQPSRIFLDSLGMRYDWVDQGAGNAIAIGRRIPLPSGVKELWVEMELRWSENFMAEIDMSRTETYAHKMFFLEAKAPATDPNWETSDGQSVYRWSVHWPGGGATNPPNGQIKVETPATTSGANVDKNIGVNAADYFDGNWHTVRLHISHDPGLFEMWVDGDRVLNLDGFTVHPEVVTTALLPGRNKDDGNPSGTESLWWGSIKAWTEDPGDTTDDTTAEPDVVFDPDLYDKTEELLTIPDSQNVFTRRGNEQDIRDDGSGGYIRLDTEVGYPGGSQSMRYDYIDQEHNRPLHVGKNMPFPEQTRDFYVEMYTRWSPNFMDMENFPQQEGRTGGNTFSHKFFFGQAIAPGEPNNWTTSDGQKVTRLSYLWPSGGSPNPDGARVVLAAPATVDPDTDTFTTARYPDGSRVNYRDFIDGEWHRHRLKVESDPGLMWLEIDGTVVINKTGFTIHPEVVFRGVLPGRNKDDGLMQGTESLWWGSIKVWLSDPGWD